MKELYSINLKDAAVLGTVAKKYLAGELPELISYSPDVKGYEKAIAGRSEYQIDRRILGEVLLKQNEGAGEKTKRNIEGLKSENTWTVTTGHQLCMFTGPLYFIYKILHAIKLSEELKKKFPSDNFVPVYWMAGEDHDFEEISSVSLFGKHLKWNSNSKGAVGKIQLQQQTGLKSVLNELQTILGESEKAREIYAVIEKCYSERNLAEATRAFVNFLFADYGLVVIDGDHPELKKHFTGIFIREIEEEFVIKSVSETNRIFEKKNLKIQVTPREINIFYLQENSRERIIKDQEVYTTSDYSKRWNKGELLQEIQMFPENFSPNVLMRALYQERILPNVAYVGGGGEISYWLQMKKMFETAGIPFPVLTVRNSLLLIDPNIAEKWRKLGFEWSEMLASEEELMVKFIERNAGTSIDFKAEEEELKKVYQIITEKLAKADTTLRGSGEAELQKALKSLEMLEGKMRRAEKQKHEQSLNQIKQIRSKLFPEGELQERVENFLPYFMKTNGNLIAELYGLMKGLESELSFREL